jgi:predicted transcriptional regulator
MATMRPAADVGLRRAPVHPRAKYEPMAHPGNQRHWERGAILAALTDWVAQTGSVPRRIDWCGEQPLRASSAQRKWMREHPWWPSSSCVASHFGSWSAALEAADLPARSLTFETSVAERVASARRLAAAGMPVREIACELGVSASSVHNYLNAGECPDCGQPVTNPRARRCSRCAGREATIARSWTREGVQAAIREWRDEHGRAPSYRDWTPLRNGVGRWAAQSPRWPSAAVVCDLYAADPNPWNAALVDAGLEVRFRRWSDDEIRAALARFWIETGRAPRSPDLCSSHWHGPHAATVRRRYGSIAAAWERLGPTPG